MQSASCTPLIATRTAQERRRMVATGGHPRRCSWGAGAGASVSCQPVPVPSSWRLLQLNICDYTESWILQLRPLHDLKVDGAACACLPRSRKLCLRRTTPGRPHHCCTTTLGIAHGRHGTSVRQLATRQLRRHVPQTDTAGISGSHSCRAAASAAAASAPHPAPGCCDDAPSDRFSCGNSSCNCTT